LDLAIRAARTVLFVAVLATWARRSPYPYERLLQRDRGAVKGGSSPASVPTP